MLLNIVNIEDEVFYDDEVWRHMPDLVRFRDQWRISKLSPSLRPTGRRALSEFLAAAKGKYEDVLSARFGTPVTIDNLDSRSVRNMEFDSLEEFPEIDAEIQYSGFGVYREENKVYLTLWR